MLSTHPLRLFALGLLYPATCMTVAVDVSIESIPDLIESLPNPVMAWQRDFHQNPEPGKPSETVGDHHTPDFYVEESGLDLGVQAMSAMAWKYMVENQP